MRRTLALLVTMAAAAVLLAAAPPPATAGVPGPITGTIYDYRTSQPVAGVTVRLREESATGPGAVAATGATDSTGTFTITPPPELPTGSSFWVEVVADSRVQGGYVGTGNPNWVEWDHEFAEPHLAGSALGRINALPSYVRGTVVNAANGNPVRNLRVSLRDAGNLSTVLGYDDTDTNGFFRINGIEGEDFGLRLIGRDRGYETGWLACNGTVVRTWGAACATGPGGQGRVRIDRL